ncbi:hypothetical protein [Eisenbergiella tayi]|uniref:glycoside hydrolase family 78 protein n=1 Tax=Eisenbergiella tayi TaxID=1432052 RepID=UPI00138DD960|nr:hypothetical protein [Eisenbergiella tayi]
MSFAIKEIYVEYQKAPIGLDEKRPRFSWIFSSDEKNMRQCACRILVKKSDTRSAGKDSLGFRETGNRRIQRGGVCRRRTGSLYGIFCVGAGVGCRRKQRL